MHGQEFYNDSRVFDYWLFLDNLNAGKAGNHLTAAAGGVQYTQLHYPFEYGLYLNRTLNQYAYRNDADLSAGFPLKSGDTQKKVSWFGWLCYPAWVSANGIIAKFTSTGNKRSLELTINFNDLIIWWGYNGGASSQSWTPITTINAEDLYFFGLAVDGVAKTAFLYWWNHRLQSYSTYSKSDWAGELNVSDAPFIIGNKGDLTEPLTAYLSKIGVSNQVLGLNDFEALRQYNLYDLCSGYVFGADETTGGTAEASSTRYPGTTDPPKAIDDNLATQWESNTPMPQWWQVDLGSSKVVNKISIRNRTMSPSVQIPGIWKLLASNTGAFGGEETTLVDNPVSCVWDSSEWRSWVFPNTEAFRYYRVYIIDIDYVLDHAVIPELQLMGCGLSIGERVFPLPPGQRFLQSQAGKRVFPLPGVQVI